MNQFPNEKLVQMALGVDKVFSIATKMVIVKTPSYQTEDTELKGLHYILFGGSGYVYDKQLSPEEWNMLEAEMILIPKAIHSNSREGWTKGLRIDQMLVRGFAKPELWEKIKRF